MKIPKGTSSRTDLTVEELHVQRSKVMRDQRMSSDIKKLELEYLDLLMDFRREVEAGMYEGCGYGPVW